MKALSFLVVFLLPLALACSGSGDGSSGRLEVVATTTQIGDFAARVGGDSISLTTILKANQDAHDFEPEPSHLRALDAADLVLLNGLHLDAFAGKSISGTQAMVVVVSEGISLLDEPAAREREETESGQREGDPHVWHSVENAIVMVANIRDALVEADPGSADVYDSNAAAYVAELEALDSEIREEVATIPQACRKLVTNHDVFGYYAEAYGFDVIGAVIPGTTSGAQASASDIAEIVHLIRDAKVPAIFAESSINPGLVEQVGREAGVDVVADLYGDSLGPSGSKGATYIGMMRANTASIVAALRGCESG